MLRRACIHLEVAPGGEEEVLGLLFTFVFESDEGK